VSENGLVMFFDDPVEFEDFLAPLALALTRMQLLANLLCGIAKFLPANCSFIH